MKLTVMIVAIALSFSVLAAYYFRFELVKVDGVGWIRLNRFTGVSESLLLNFAEQGRARSLATAVQMTEDERKAIAVDQPSMKNVSLGDAFQIRIFNGTPNTVVRLNLTLQYTNESGAVVTLDMGSRLSRIEPYTWGDIDSFLSSAQIPGQIWENGAPTYNLTDALRDKKFVKPGIAVSAIWVTRQ